MELLFKQLCNCLLYTSPVVFLCLPMRMALLLFISSRLPLDVYKRQGMERAADTEDLITIGMRGDGDTPMGGKEGEDDTSATRTAS